ncbi:Type IV secretory pathway, VirD2 components (relaxase) [plant metagenome]|uniref:Type IV secretory pathway, VirD2 components (Relaxase) n=1 Tax=plant metagenome TaxID=1297885 RepID=A0A484YX85_9ZZZZ
MQLASRFPSRSPSLRSDYPLTDDQIHRVAPSIFADDGMGLSLVPWRPVFEPRLGQQIAATMRDSGVSWEIRRQRGPSVG